MHPNHMLNPPARADSEVERVGPLDGSRWGASSGEICRTTDAVVGGASAAVSGVAMQVVSLDNAIRAGSMIIRMEYV